MHTDTTEAHDPRTTAMVGSLAGLFETLRETPPVRWFEDRFVSTLAPVSPAWRRHHHYTSGQAGDGL